MSEIEKRLKKLRINLEEKGLDAFFIYNFEKSSWTSSFYFTGFTGSFSLILIKSDDVIFFTDGRYVEQAKNQIPFSVNKYEGKLDDNLEKIFSTLKPNSKIGIEFPLISLSFYNKYLKKIEEKYNFVFVDVKDMISSIRKVKSEDEVNRIKDAILIAEKALENSLNHLKPGISEKEFAALLEYNMKILGADAIAFETIVASGYRSALPHGIASDKKIEKGEFVVIDFGAFVNGYNSDITRTVYVGKPSEEELKIYNLVLKVQKEAIERVRANIKASEPDLFVRKKFEEMGYEQYFVHSLGHGLGIEVHEEPRVSKLSNDILQSGNVITIEPGLYFEGKYGIRIEDDVLVTENGCEVLTSFSKELITI